MDCAPPGNIRPDHEHDWFCGVLYNNDSEESHKINDNSECDWFLNVIQLPV